MRKLAVAILGIVCGVSVVHVRLSNCGRVVLVLIRGIWMLGMEMLFFL